MYVFLWSQRSQADPMASLLSDFDLRPYNMKGECVRTKLVTPWSQSNTERKRVTGSHDPFGSYIPSDLMNAHQTPPLRDSITSLSTKLKIMPSTQGLWRDIEVPMTATLKLRWELDENSWCVAKGEDFRAECCVAILSRWNILSGGKRLSAKYILYLHKPNPPSILHRGPTSKKPYFKE